MNVAVIGASPKEDRYSFKALGKLEAAGHTVFAIRPGLKNILHWTVYPNLEAVTEPIDTVTLYVNAEASSKMVESILAKKPRRIIFNPGAENPELMIRAQLENIECLEACTLVMLSTHQF